jgi:hypothetical protein
MNSNDETFLVFWDALNGGVEAELLPASKGESGKEFDAGIRFLI